MDPTAQRRLIAQKSPLQQRADPRPRCEGCSRVLTSRDYASYWDGQDPSAWREPGMSAADHLKAITPRVCEDCAEEAECKST